jgi:hypothetical protein
MHLLKYNEIDHKTHFTVGANSYMFQHQRAVLRKFINDIGS